MLLIFIILLDFQYKFETSSNDSILKTIQQCKSILNCEMGKSNSKLCPQLFDNLDDDLPPPIFKLNVDCFEEIFDYLSLGELCIFRRTCRRMKQVVDYYIKLNYRLALRKLHMNEERLDYFCHHKTVGFKFVNHLSILECKLRAYQIPGIITILGQIEGLRISTKQFDGDLYDDLLQFCTRLKSLHLYIHHNALINGKKNGWIQQHYPHLEHFVLNFCSPFEREMRCFELKAFFERNTDIRFFSTRFRVLWNNRDWVLGSNLSFNQLTIGTFYRTDHTSIASAQACNFLNCLHEQGFYQKLRIDTEASIALNQFSHIGSLRALETLSVGYGCISDYGTVEKFLKSPLLSLKELYLRYLWRPQDLETLANYITNVNRIFIERASINDIVLLIRRCTKLKEIRVNRLKEGNLIKSYFEDDSIHSWRRILFDNCINEFRTLNHERKALRSTRKVTIFVDETVFLALKSNNKTHFEFIEFKRTQAWGRDYQCLFRGYDDY